MRRLAAEMLGTFALVFAGTGASSTAVGSNTMYPAVTLGFFAARRFKARWVAPYIASQCAGALLASLGLRLMFPTNATLGATVPAGDPLQSFVLEAILTFLLMFVILSVSTGSKEKGILAGVAVGSVIGLEALFAGPISGASMNPAARLPQRWCRCGSTASGSI